MNETWTKRSYVCDPDVCDSLYEITVNDKYPANVTDITCHCGRGLFMVSVVDATILPITQTKEEKMEDATPQVMKLDWIENDVVVNKEYTESDVRHMVWVNKNLSEKQNEWYRKESQLRSLLEDTYANSDDQDTLAQVAEIFDVPLTKEIEVTAWVRVDMTIEVDMADADYDIEQLVSDNLTIDSFGSEINVNGHDVERVEEGAY